MKKILIPIIVLLLLIPTLTFAAEEQEVHMYMFYGKGCPHCGKLLDFTKELEEKYPSLIVNEYEIYFDDNNRNLFEEMAGSFGTQIQGVPTVFVDDKVIVGFSNALGNSIEQQIQNCLIEECGDPIEKVHGEETVELIGDKSPLEDPEKTKLKQSLTIPVVLSAAAVDAINPCAFAVLIILMTTILVSHSKKKALFAGLAFTSSIYISYFLMGIGLYSAIQVAGLTHTFYMIVAVLAILVGLFNLKDYLWYGKWFIMEVPLSWRPKMKSLIKSITSVPGAFMIGFAVSLFLLPCTSGPYIVILGLLAKTTTRSYALILLLLYNFIFVLPMIIITGAIAFGFTTTEKAEQWRIKRLKVLHLIAGIIILLLGVGMLIALQLGMV